jgi:hypothetical protein
MKRNWSPAQVNWSEYANGSPWMSAGAMGGADRGSTSLGVVTFNSTGSYSIAFNEAGLTLVQNWIDNPSTNYGIILFGGSSDAVFIFASSENASSSSRPRLQIQYTP